MAAKFPGWQPKESHLEVGVIEENARINSETSLVAVNVGDGIFRAFGQDLLSLSAIDGAKASFSATVTAIDDAGYTLPAGTHVRVAISGDEYLYFVTLVDAVIPQESETVANVVFVAEQPGESHNGFAIGTTYELYDNVGWVESIVSTTASSGGVEAELDEDYLDRLADELKLMTPRPILPEDFAVLALRTPGVYRAVAVDGYDPGPPEAFDQERMVAVAAVDDEGQPVPPEPTLDQLAQDLEAMREVNFVVNTMGPTYTEVDIVFQVKARDGYVLADVEAEAEAAVIDFIHPAHWGNEQDADGNWLRKWERKTILRYLEVATIIENIEGVDHITTTGGLFDLTINGARVDLALGGQAPLPKPVGPDPADSSVAGTVVA
jgi:hypothetical protein